MRDKLISKISQIVTSSDISESDVDHLMTLIRKLQEETSNDPKNYPLLIFFCDWTKHTHLSWNPEVSKIIVELNEQLFLQKSGSTDDVIQGISQVISFERLQADLSTFLSYYDLPLDIVTKKDLWLRYVINLINIISDSSLQLPEKNKDMIKRSIKSGVIASSLKYVWINQGIFSPEATVTKVNVLALAIRLSDTTTLITPCKILGKFITSELK